MKNFIHDNFLLQSDVARELYHDYAAPLPIYDFHSHLSPQLIAENHCFTNLTELWLAGDHYKWRAMRWHGLPEKFCTGDASDWEKFFAYAQTMPKLLGHPLYHWTHLELKRYFAIDDFLDESSAESIWQRANEQLVDLPVREILRRSKVAVCCTTDDPLDTLEFHRKIRDDSSLTSKAFPTYRPDRTLMIDKDDMFGALVRKLSEVSSIDCGTFDGFLTALRQRHDFFHEAGCRLSDHGLSFCYADDCSHEEAQAIFKRAQAHKEISPDLANKFRSYLMGYFGELDAARGWTKQLHLGAMRDVNPRAYREIGSDSGYDSMSDVRQGEPLARYLAKLDQAGHLPNIILYNSNPNDNYLFATIAGSFQSENVAGRVQLGSAWWFLDQKDGIEAQLQSLANVGLLSDFVGMVTDSRSLLSFSRHEYFRRILCNWVGAAVVRSELPRDMKLIGGMIADICYHNARRYFALGDE